MIDFTNCQIDLSANYGGSDKKRGIIYNDKKYMLKLSDKISEEKRNNLNSSYSNSAFSEYIGCHILKSIGFNVQNTLLGNITMTSSKGYDRTYPVVACENFIPQGYSLVEFKFIESAVLALGKPPRIPKLKDIYEILTNENEYFNKEFGEIALKSYWDLFIVDALLGNFDRHANNWGYLVKDGTNEIKLAPIYDCGSCLYPQIADEATKDIINSEEEVQKRIDKFPQAALSLDDGTKVNYKQYINSFENQDCTDALFRIFPKIDMNKIHDIINDTKEISDVRKEFYCFMLDKRYEQILKAPYLRYLEMQGNKQKASPIEIQNIKQETENVPINDRPKENIMYEKSNQDINNDISEEYDNDFDMEL